MTGVPASISATNDELAARLLALTADSARDSLVDDLAEDATSPIASLPDSPVLRDADVVVTHVEVNDRHGVGVLIRRLFAGYPGVISIRSANLYDGQHEFGDLSLCLSHQDTSRDAVFSRVLCALGGCAAARVLCVPYFPDDVRNAIAVKEIFGVPLCTYLMDDQNICLDGIPDDLMRELLVKSSLRLAISGEICVAYEMKYGCKMWLMPPVAPARYILSEARVPAAPSRSGVIIGNVWGRRWLELLRQTVRDSGVTLHWYCSGDLRWLGVDQDALVKDSIIVHAAAPEQELVEILRESYFTVVPSGVLDETDDRRFIARLSLPSRIPYILATSHVPFVVLGSRDSAAARFVEEFGIGSVSPYEREPFQSLVDHITRPEVNLRMRKKALAMAARFSDVGAAEWLWQSLARGEPIDRRYEDLRHRHSSDPANLSPSSVLPNEGPVER